MHPGFLLGYLPVSPRPAGCIPSPVLAYPNPTDRQKVKVKSPYNMPRRPRVVEVKLYSSFNLGARLGWVVNATPRPIYSRERPGTHCTGAWVGPSDGLDGYGKSLPPTGIRSPDRPSRSKSLYLLRYPKGYRYIPRICNTYCLSTATLVARTLLSVSF